MEAMLLSLKHGSSRSPFSDGDEPNESAPGQVRLGSGMVTGLSQHEEAAPHLKAASRGDIELVLIACAVAECYASLTALPISPEITSRTGAPPHRREYHLAC